MGTINKAANMYRQNKNGKYVQAETAGRYLSHCEYHPRRATHYRANNQRPAERRRNIRLHSKH